MSAVQKRDVLTVDEFREALAAFSKADRIRLMRYASYYCGGTGMEADDLMQEAIGRSLDEKGGRWCPRDVNPVIFLGNAMRSIASAERIKWARETPVGESNDGMDPILEEPDPGPDPERIVSEWDSNGRIIDQIENLFADDPQALAIVMGDMDGCSPEEICDLEPMTKTEFATARRRVRRTIQRKFPDGADHDG